MKPVVKIYVWPIKVLKKAVLFTLFFYIYLIAILTDASVYGPQADGAIEEVDLSIVIRDTVTLQPFF
jgi:hypothetical protein